MCSQSVQWANRTVSIAEKCVLINIYHPSKLWYLSHIIPFTEHFFMQLESILQGWIWAPSCSHACKITSLYGPKDKGGLGLIDAWVQSRRILAKKMTAVFLPQPIDSNQKSWHVAVQMIFSHHVKIQDQNSLLALPRWLAKKPYQNGPHLACMSCQALLDSHLHQFFLCPTVAPFWSMLKGSLQERPPDPDNPLVHQYWFLLKSNLGVPSSIQILVFHLGLWVCHSSTVATFSGEPPLPPLAKLNQFRDQFSEHILHLLKHSPNNRKTQRQVTEWKSALKEQITTLLYVGC